MCFLNVYVYVGDSAGSISLDLRLRVMTDAQAANIHCEHTANIYIVPELRVRDETKRRQLDVQNVRQRCK